jgi:hypothetical protein
MSSHEALITDSSHHDALITDSLISAVGIETAVVLVVALKVLGRFLGKDKKQP